MNNSLTTAQAAQVAGVAGVTTAYLIFALILCVVEIVATWKIFTKAGKPGWASIIPIYNVYVLLQIAGLEWWYLLLLCIPLVNIYAVFKMNIELAHKFGKSTAFGILMVFFSLICTLVLAFGSAKYEKSAKKK